MSSELNDFLKLVAEAKAKDPKHQALKQVKENAKADLDSLLTQLSQVKATDPQEKLIKKVKENVAKDVTAMLSDLQSTPQPEKLTEAVEFIEEIVEPKTPEQRQDDVTKYLSALPKDSHSFQQPIAPEISNEMKAVTDKLKFLEQWVAKISAAGPGGGAGDVINLDHQTKLVITPTYMVSRKDYYIGVNYAGTVTITLPVNVKNGRYVIIKDESGRCSKFPIIVQGNVDNDPGGFILRIDNGGIQMIYRDGWRIV